MKRINSEVIKKQIKIHGLGKTSDETGISVHTLMRMSGDNYHNEPNATTRKALCRFFKLTEDELFLDSGEEAG